MVAFRTNMRHLFVSLFLSFIPIASGLAGNSEKAVSCSRKAFLERSIAGASLVPYLLFGPVPSAQAVDGQKKLGLTDEQLKEIVKSDVLDRQFLVSGDLTRSIYLPTAPFKDEIDTYSMDQWIKGTQKLFVGKKSQVRLVGDVNVSPSQVEFRFDEDLMFNIPFKPVVSLTGKVVLTRDEQTGYVTSYTEYWDQDVLSVLKTAKF
jgi:hypothetical protein